jgi:type IV pilus assembly protein PilX
MRSFITLRLAHHQQGAALAVSLFMLLILTLIGVSGMRGTILQERMASNTRDRSISFQAAESAVRDAEAFLETIVTTGGFNGTAGLFADTQAAPDFLAASTWSSDANSVVASTVSGSYAAPRYFIKQTAILAGTQGAMNLKGYANNKGTGDVTTFHITARGIGGSTDSSEVILRSYYGRKF